MKKNAVETDRRRVKKLVEGKNFDFLIMSLICMDAVILGLMTSDAMNRFFEGGLFILDRLFMAIFIIEMIMKIFAFGKKFFKSGWNVFDFAVIAISSVPFASWFIIFRTFRLFRLLRYVNKFTRLKQMINTFLALLPNFMAMLLVMAVFFYVFAIMAVCLFGDVFIEFSDLGSSLFALLQVITLDGWASNIARPVMAVFPHSWLFFVSFVFISFLITVSFLMSVVSEVVRRAFNLKSRL
ncbi:MAG: ion transporter [Alphaproteobacteria bacterium]|jgi:ion transport protein|uniref:ion transporter n=1 Tax=Candidatus Scatocola faecigallinarum TaxID=2840916 RepID=UPI000337F280|nr:ion transporter [Azospirillum sp.]CDB53371.1 ion transport protein [Azospirillum sp. CAG:239]